MATIWILIANSAQARVFNVDEEKMQLRKDGVHLVAELTHPQSRQRDTQLTSDRSGNFHAKAGGSGSFIEATDPKKHESELFAHELVETLEAARVAHRFKKLILIAPPHFYGLLNKIMHAPLQRMINQVVEKDYTSLKAHEINQFVTRLLGYSDA